MEETDHEKRLRRSATLTIVRRKKEKYGYCVTVKDKQEKHVVVMKKEKRGRQNKRISQGRSEPRFRTAPNSNYKTRVDKPSQSLQQKSTMPIVKITTYKSCSCTCPDWNYRGVYHRNDRSEKPTEFKIAPSGRRMGQLRASRGCKHMLKADAACAHD